MIFSVTMLFELELRYVFHVFEKVFLKDYFFIFMFGYNLKAYIECVFQTKIEEKTCRNNKGLRWF